MDRFFGGKPIVVLLKLAIISLVVGIVLAALNLDAFQLLDSIRRLVVRIYEMGFDAIEWALQYFLLGAVIVFPIWLIARLVKTAGSRSDDTRS
jgi:hypothetical protein